MRRTVAVLLLAVLTSTLVGCGSPEERRELTVVGTEMAFEAPASSAAGRYVVRFENDGALFHEVAIKDATGRVLRRTQAEPGGTSQMEVELAPGTYELGCFEPGQYEGGMHRRLVVSPPA